jgi:hypothetical protein
MAVLHRIFVILIAFGTASLVAGTILTVETVLRELHATSDFGLRGFVMTAGLYTVFVAAFALLPTTLVVVVAEMYRLRSPLFYATAGAVVGTVCLLALFFLLVSRGFHPGPFYLFPIYPAVVWVAAGIIAAIVYWAIAGYKAGDWRKRPFAADAGTPEAQNL